MYESINKAVDQLEGIILGKRQQIRLSICCVLARGHLLLEDIPGVGKTTLASALARVLGLEITRVQFTSDLLPADLVGVSIWDKELSTFRFQKGPVFTHLLLGDEINRATPKTQSALLEAMEEHRVSVDGQTHELPQPFVVIATQNPEHQIGTFPLPESQLDRFLMRLSMGYPDRSAERAMLAGRDRRELVAQLVPATDMAELVRVQEAVDRVHIAEPIREYLLDLVAATRQTGMGLSPRAALALQRASRAWALMEGRSMVIPEDVQAVAPSIMVHRLGDRHLSGEAVAERILSATPVP